MITLYDFGIMICAVSVLIGIAIIITGAMEDKPDPPDYEDYNGEEEDSHDEEV
jgi:hypothetical protein